MKSFFASTSARLQSLAFGIALLGGAMWRSSDGATALALGATGIAIAITLSVFALATAVEDHFGPATLAVLMLPWALFLGYLGLRVMPEGAFYAVYVLAAPFLGFALRPAPSGARIVATAPG